MEPKRIRMRALVYHTYDGKEYHEGDTYDAEEGYVETLEAVKFAERAPADAPHTPANHTRKHAK